MRTGSITNFYFKCNIYLKRGNKLVNRMHNLMFSSYMSCAGLWNCRQEFSASLLHQIFHTSGFSYKTTFLRCPLANSISISKHMVQFCLRFKSLTLILFSQHIQSCGVNLVGSKCKCKIHFS